MIIPVKYHIFTIIAIFFALGFGILIGSSFIKSEKLVEKQQALISGIDRDIKETKNINGQLNLKVDRLEKNIAERKELEAKYLSFSLKDKLKDESYYILAEDNYQKSYKMIEDIFASAGARAQIISSIDNLSISPGDRIIIWNKKNFDFDKIIDGPGIKAENFIIANTDRLIEFFMILQDTKI